MPTKKKAAKKAVRKPFRAWAIKHGRRMIGVYISTGKDYLRWSYDKNCGEGSFDRGVASKWLSVVRVEVREL